MPDYSTLDLKIEYVKTELSEIKAMIKELKDDEKCRLEGYNESNTELAVLKRRVEVIEQDKAETRRSNFSLWALIIAGLSFIGSLILHFVR